MIVRGQEQASGINTGIRQKHYPNPPEKNCSSDTFAVDKRRKVSCLRKYPLKIRADSG